MNDQNHNAKRKSGLRTSCVLGWIHARSGERSATELLQGAALACRRPGECHLSDRWAASGTTQGRNPARTDLDARGRRRSGVISQSPGEWATQTGSDRALRRRTPVPRETRSEPEITRRRHHQSRSEFFVRHVGRADGLALVPPGIDCSSDRVHGRAIAEMICSRAQ